MARLDTYSQDIALSGNESLLGNDEGIAQNFKLSRISDYILGLKGDRKIPIKSQSDLTIIPPVTTVGTRYINTTTGEAPYMGINVTANNIYEIVDGMWYEVVPSEGFNVWDKELKKNLYFDGTDWIIDVCLSGTTSNRPTLNLRIGLMYFETTLGYPIWYKGSSVWVNANGTTV